MVILEVLPTQAEIALPMPVALEVKFRISKPWIATLETPLAMRKASPGAEPPSITGAFGPGPALASPGSPKIVTDLSTAIFIS